MRILAIGDIGVVNSMMHIGDEAMFEEFVAQARRRGIRDIVAVSSNPDDTSARYGLESVPRLGLSGDRASMIAQAPFCACRFSMAPKVNREKMSLGATSTVTGGIGPIPTSPFI